MRYPEIGSAAEDVFQGLFLGVLQLGMDLQAAHDGSGRFQYFTEDVFTVTDTVFRRTDQPLQKRGTGSGNGAGDKNRGKVGGGGRQVDVGGHGN